MKKHMEKLSTLNNTDLKKRSIDLASEITELRRGIKTGDVQNTQVLKNKRKELARVLTIIAKPEVQETVKEVKVMKTAKAVKKENK